MKPINPLKQEHLDALNAVIANAEMVRDFIKRCKECGLDVAAAEAQHEQQLDFARRVKQQFFPGAS